LLVVLGVPRKRHGYLSLYQPRSLKTQPSISEHRLAVSNNNLIGERDQENIQSLSVDTPHGNAARALGIKGITAIQSPHRDFHPPEEAWCCGSLPAVK
jgi:hypothetical protein